MNILNTIVLFFKRLRNNARQDPARDWLTLITLSMIAFVAIVVWNIWTFDTVANGGVIGAPVSKSPPMFDRALLETVHTIFATRAAEESKYQNGTYHFGDPSQ